jgi:protein gp37
MAETTTIEWTRNDDGTPGRTWNPVTGCTKISAGCDNCYAETIAERFRGTAAFPHGFDVSVRADKVNAPLKWRKPTRVFVNSMSDLFHTDVDREWIAEIFGVMAAARRHTFQLLTKRHARMRSLLNDPGFIHKVRHRAEGKGLPIGGFSWPLPNVWLGVSVENQQWADIRIPALLDTPAAIRFLSCEPLLGPVDLGAWMPEGHAAWRCQGPDCRRFYSGPLQQHCPDCGREGHWTGSHTGNGRPNGQPIGWVITGGESGRKARPMAPQWATSLRDQCATAGVPFFFKQWGEYAPTGYLVIGGTSKGTLLAGDPVDDLGHRVELARVGKKNAGRELDGRTHDAFPMVVQ